MMIGWTSGNLSLRVETSKTFGKRWTSSNHLHPHPLELLKKNNALSDSVNESLTESQSLRNANQFAIRGEKSYVCKEIIRDDSQDRRYQRSSIRFLICWTNEKRGDSGIFGSFFD